MEILLAIFSFALCFLGALINRRHIINPVSLFHFIWGFSFLVYSLRRYLFPTVELNNLNAKITAYYAATLLSFFLGGLIARYFYAAIAKRFGFRRLKASGLNNISERKFPILQVTSSASVVLSIIALLNSEISLVQYIKNGDVIRAAMTLEYNPTKNIASLLASYFAFVALPLCSILLFTSTNRKLWMYFPFISLFIVSAMALGKYNILISMAIVFNSWVLCNNPNVRNLLKVVKPIIYSIFVVIILFSSTALIRKNVADEINFSEKSFPVSFLLFMYGFGHVNNFTEYYNTLDTFTGDSSTQNAGFTNFSQNQKRYFGERTFSGVYRVLYWVGLKNSVSYTRYEGVRNFNTFSILRNFIDDFGVNGSLAAMVATGFICNLLFLGLNKNKASGIILITFIFLFIEFTVIHSIFNFIFVYIVLVFSPLMSRLTIGRGREPIRWI